MGVSWTTWFDGAIVRLGERLTLWERLRQPPRLRGIRVGALATMAYRGTPLLISLEGAGLLRVGRAVRWVSDGGVWCVAAPPGRPVDVHFRNLAGEVEQRFDVPAAVLAEAPRRVHVPEVRRVGAVRLPVGAPSLRVARTIMTGAVAALPTARDKVPTLPPVRVSLDDGAWVVDTLGMPSTHLVSDDEDTLRRVAVRISRNAPRSLS